MNTKNISKKKKSDEITPKNNIEKKYRQQITIIKSNKKQDQDKPITDVEQKADPHKTDLTIREKCKDKACQKN